MTHQQKAAEAEKAKAGKDDKGKEASDKVLSNQHDAPIAAPAPALLETHWRIPAMEQGPDVADLRKAVAQVAAEFRAKAFNWGI